jgi:aryl-alcohol dehydrogenase-like predicted oxidoreductase
LPEAENLAVIPYSPLGGGLLSGKYGIGRKPESGRLLDNTMYGKRYRNEEYYEIAERFTAYAQEDDTHPASLAVAWVLAHPAVTALSLVRATSSNWSHRWPLLKFHERRSAR